MGRLFKTRSFARWAASVGLADSALRTAVAEMERGLVDADLGSGVYKKRVALPGRGKRGGARTIVVTNRGDRWFFVLGFAKNERADLEAGELLTLRDLASDLLGHSLAKIERAVQSGVLLEVLGGRK